MNQQALDEEDLQEETSSNEEIEEQFFELFINDERTSKFGVLFV